MLKFYELGDVDDAVMSFAIIISKSNDKWVMCKHKKRTTWEIPGGKIEPAEEVDDCAKRELYEETGASEYTIERIFIFEENDLYAMVYLAEITEFDPLPESEMEKVELFEDLNLEWTYPNIQPILIEYLKKIGI